MSTQHLGVEYGHGFFSKALAISDEAKAINEALLERGLSPQAERTHVFSVFSPKSQKSIAISITPYSSKDQREEGGLSLSQGGHAQAVVVELKNKTQITGFTHFAAPHGKVTSSYHTTKELYSREGACEGEREEHVQAMEHHIKSFAEKIGKVKSARPLIEIEPYQVRSLASISYNHLLGDEFSKTVHAEDEISALRGNTSIVSDIGLFVLFRTQGSSCCSCSCSCWGSSSCSSSYGG